MKKFFLASIMMIIGIANSDTSAKETITVVIGAAPTQSSVPVVLKTLDKANDLQKKYSFAPEFKPGAQGVIAVRYMDLSPLNRISGIAASFVENVKSGQLVESDYAPVSAQGDACWAVITNVGDTKQGINSLSSIKGKEIVAGGTGFGNAAHLTSLILAEKYGFKVKYVVFKANFDALINMVGDNGVNFVVDRIAAYNQFKEKQPKLQILGVNCHSRHHQMPEIKTLREQGADAPMIFNMIVANKAMPEGKRREIGSILDQAQAEIGKKEMIDMADLLAPQFSNVSTEEFFSDRIDLIKRLTAKYEKQIEASK